MMLLKRILMFGTIAVQLVGEWLLSGGTWNDSGIWKDNETWED